MMIGALFEPPEHCLLGDRATTITMRPASANVSAITPASRPPPDRIVTVIVSIMRKEPKEAR